MGMPTRNIIKVYGEEQYYHVYNRGVDRMNIFRDAQDYYYFISLFRRHLSPEESQDASGRPHKKYHDQLEIVAYCLMPNHFHLLIYLKEKKGLETFMRSAMTSYSYYFNKKYNRVGTMFQNHFLAAHISHDYYLWHVSRYIHLNPLDINHNYLAYPYSSLRQFLGETNTDWLQENRLVDTVTERQQYKIFVSDHESVHRELHHLKHILAG